MNKDTQCMFTSQCVCVCERGGRKEKCRTEEEKCKGCPLTFLKTTFPGAGSFCFLYMFM